MIEKRNQIRCLRWLLVLVMSFSTVSAAAAEVRVQVFEAIDGNGAMYFYRVENGTTQPIVGLRIGYDFLHGLAQLRTPPVGWTFDQGIPASSATSPSGWTPRVVTTEESELIDMEWSSDAGAQFDIAPGATCHDFAVRLPKASAEYRTANFDVILGDSTHVHGVVEP